MAKKPSKSDKKTRKKARSLLKDRVETRRAEQARLGPGALTTRQFTTAVSSLMRKEGITRGQASRRIKLAQADRAAGGSTRKLGEAAARKRRKK